MVVIVVAIAIRRRGLVLLNPRGHLLDQLLAQAIRRFEHPAGVGILCLEIRNDLRIFAFPEPEIIVCSHVPVAFELDRPLRGDRVVRSFIRAAGHEDCRG